MYDPISLGLGELKAAKNRKQILLLTDGFDTRSKNKAAEAEESLRKSDALVYAIGIDDDDNAPRTHKRPRYRIFSGTRPQSCANKSNPERSCWESFSRSDMTDSRTLSGRFERCA